MNLGQRWTSGQTAHGFAGNPCAWSWGGDAANANLCAVGNNCRLLLACFRRLSAGLIASIAFGIRHMLPALTGQQMASALAAASLPELPYVLHG